MTARRTGRLTAVSALMASVIPERMVGALIRRVYPRIEPELARVTEFVPRGGTALDVGGWYGPWTRGLRMMADSVVTVEPNAQLAGNIRAAYPDVRVIEAAVSDRTGTARLYLPDAGPAVGTSSLESGVEVSRTSSPASACDRSVMVPLITVDGLHLTDVRFMKIDVEGHELAALRGAAETIHRDGPVLIVEVEERVQPVEPVVDLLTAWGYRGYVLPEDRWIPLAEFDLVGHQRQAIRRVRQSFVRRVLIPRPRYVNSVLFRRA